MFPKVVGKFPKKIRTAYENSKIFHEFLMPMPRLPNAVLLL